MFLSTALAVVVFAGVGVLFWNARLLATAERKHRSS
jgi:hypothetical protein